MGSADNVDKEGGSMVALLCPTPESVLLTHKTGPGLILTPDEAIPPSFARMACRFARRAARVSSTGGGVVTRSSSTSGSCSDCTEVEGLSGETELWDFETSLADIEGGRRDEADVDGDALRLCPEILRYGQHDNCDQLRIHKTYSPSSRSAST